MMQDKITFNDLVAAEMEQYKESGEFSIDLHGQTYDITSPILIKNVEAPEIINGTLVDRTKRAERSIAALGFVASPKVNLRGITLRDVTNTGIGLANCPGSTIDDIAILGSKPGAGRMLQATASNQLTLRDSEFRASGSSMEVVSVSNGHPWYMKGPEHYFAGGMNRAAFIGNKENRVVIAQGGTTLPIRFDPSVVKNSQADYKKNVWLAYWPDKPNGVTFTAEAIDLKEGKAILRIHGSGATFPDGKPVSWYTYDPTKLTKQVTITGNTFTGARDGSGLSLYWVDGFLIQNNTAFGNEDYGIGVEWCQNGVISGNNAHDNQRGWNQIELVFLSKEITVRDNKGIVGLVSWGNPVIGVSIDTNELDQKESYNRIWRTHQWKSNDWPQEEGRIFGWYESVKIAGEPYQPPFYYVPLRLIKLHFARD